MFKENIMKKLFVLLVAVILSSSAFACDRFVRCGGGYGNGGAGYSDQYRGGYRGQSIGREIAEVGIGGAIAVAALQVGAAVGGRIAQEISGTPPQQRVVYAQQPPQVVVVAACTPRSMVSPPLVYADRCDGRGYVVVGRID
jgi:hypothetical protein